MHQLLFDFGLTSIPSLDNFVIGTNGHLIAAILGMRNSKDRQIYLWGDTGIGKSHLLKASCAQYLPSRYLTANNLAEDFRFDAQVMLYCVDDVHQFDKSQQIALFNLINDTRAAQIPLVASGDTPPAQLTLRDDLTTRLGWGLVFRLKALSDSEKQKVLQEHVKSLGLKLSDDVIPYLLRHFARDLPTLMQLLNELDKYSLAIHKPLTLPVMRAYLQQERDRSQSILFDAIA